MFKKCAYIIAGCLFLGWGCAKKTEKQTFDGALVRIYSTESIDKISLWVFNKEGASDSIQHVLSEERSLSEKPLQIVLKPSYLTQNVLRFYAVGYRKSVRVVAEASFIDMKSVPYPTVELHLKTTFLDRDGDSFPSCDQQGCDCNDGDARTYPFKFEVCGDGVDNNCSGLPAEEGCACTSTDLPQVCTPVLRKDASKAGIGACQLGEITCVNGQWDTVCKANFPVEEIPNNKVDDDCDGSVDEGSKCRFGESRLCHRGFIDDPSDANPFKRTLASDKAQGVCADAEGKAKGVQRCSIDAVWGLCEADVLPERDVSNPYIFKEKEKSVLLNTPGQCDGLDNDCDGLVDEERYYDEDQDGYTYCGTCFSDGTLTHGLCEERIDCDDKNNDVSPSKIELCGNTIDDDCRCDRGDHAGKPVLAAYQGERRCTSLEAQLYCDENVSCAGYYYGFEDISDDGLSNPKCKKGSGFVALSCVSESNMCQDSRNVCQQNGFEQIRPETCHVFSGSGCTGFSSPVENPSSLGSDVYNDCENVDCSGYYAFISNECRKGPSSVDNTCNGDGACQEEGTLCSNASKTTVVGPSEDGKTHLCDGTCTSTTPPRFEADEAGCSP